MSEKFEMKQEMELHTESDVDVEKDKKKKRLYKILISVFVVLGVITLACCVAFTIWLAKQGIDIRRFIIRPPVVNPIIYPLPFGE